MFADKLIKNLASKNSSKNASLKDVTLEFDTRVRGEYYDYAVDLKKDSDTPLTEQKTILEVLTSPVNGHRCQFFNFGHIPYSYFDDEYEATFPAWSEGFLKLPAPICFFEFTTSLSSHNELMANNDSFEKKVVSFWKDRGPIKNLNLGYLLMEVYDPELETSGVSMETFGSMPTTGFIFPAGAAKVRYGERDAKRIRRGSVEVGYGEKVGEEEFSVNTQVAPVLIMLGRLNAEGIEKSVVLPPEKLNRRRKKRNQPELVTHTTVRVAPYRAPLGRSGPREGEDFTPPRYHFRRGHIRRFQNGEKTWVRSCFVGSPTDGSVQHDYVVNA